MPIMLSTDDRFPGVKPAPSTVLRPITGQSLFFLRVFYLFPFQVPPFKGTVEEKGFVLGIKASKYLIDQQEGEFEIESELGSCTTFTVVLPVNRLKQCYLFSDGRMVLTFKG